MEIILLEDVKSLGKKGEKYKVSDGYGRNLISKKLCLEATAKNLNDLKLQKKHEEKVALEKLEAAQKLGDSLKDKQVVMQIKAGEGGKLFGAISSKEISKEIQNQLGVEIDKKKIQLPDAIKTLGNHEVTIKLHPKVTTTVIIKVTQC